MAPMEKNALGQPKLSTIHATSGGASMAPIDEPLLNMPEASARSLLREPFGHHFHRRGPVAGLADSQQKTACAQR